MVVYEDSLVRVESVQVSQSELDVMISHIESEGIELSGGTHLLAPSKEAIDILLR